MNASTHRRGALALLALALSSCGGGSSADDEVVSIKQTANGKVVSRRTFRITELEERAVVARTPSKSTRVLVAEGEERFDGMPAAQPTLTAAALHTFLHDEWDPLVEGAEDEGVNARRFGDLLAATSLTPARFMTAYRASGASLADFVAFLEATMPLDETHGRFAVEHLLDLLGQNGVGLAQLNASLAKRGKTHADFVAEVRARPRGVLDLRRSWAQSGKALTEFLGAEPPPNPDDSGPGIVAGVAIGQLAWDLIHGDTDITTQTSPSSALNPADMNPLNYVSAQPFTGPEFDDVVEGHFSGTDVRIHANVIGTYGATNASVGGKYLPSVSVTFSEISTNSGASMDASAEVTSVTYAGTPDNMVPTITILMHYKASSNVWSTIRWDDSQTIAGDQGPTANSNLRPSHSF